jgi:hypothetical protein
MATLARETEWWDAAKRAAAAQVAEDDTEWWEEVPGVEQDGKGKKVLKRE